MECLEVGNSFLCDRRINKAHHKREVLIFQCTKSIIWNHSPCSYMTSDLLVQVLTYKIWWVSWQSIQLKKDNKGENNYTCCLNTYSKPPPPPPPPKKKQKGIKKKYIYTWFGRLHILQGKYILEEGKNMVNWSRSHHISHNCSSSIFHT